ncbi:hypothetical protein [Pseudomonas syringae]|uniref:hypothetical protein n=1 Tax=Pseudomonas syringae TaxID=317 RepID=UPI0018E5C907|nr:hypothetical protein [Pseudomonas syringae]MBI6772827.1 hypothetical protein [Pseudomonas syringae]MBI6774304.1 hypothetical protein [Pseudomonas syringae]MBI6794148.1 hypothetical protein [Pseudomonas syringae]MBI6803109.1 hypothetical protein [Pseudomonas syringae]MBI6834417.1 hypothetical protein [Pseudomonas syringae]
MQATDNLHKLHDSVQRRISSLQSCYNSIAIKPAHDGKVLLSYIAIELDNLNVSALREFTVSTIRGAKTILGNRVSVNVKVRKEEEIAAYILSIANTVKYKNMKNPISIQRDREHTVRDPKITERIFLDCGASNISSLQNALSLNSSMFRDIAPIRNFYAHRCGDTFKKVESRAKNLGVPKISHPADLLNCVLTGRPHSILADWLFDAEIFYNELMQ